MLLHRDFHHLVLVFDLRHIHHLAKLLQLVSLALEDYGCPDRLAHSTFNATCLAMFCHSYFQIFDHLTHNNVLQASRAKLHICLLLYWSVFCWHFLQRSHMISLMFPPSPPQKKRQAGWRLLYLLDHWHMHMGLNWHLHYLQGTKCQVRPANGVEGTDKWGPAPKNCLTVDSMKVHF